MIEKQPDRLYIDSNDRALYDELSEEIFNSSDLKERKNQFFFAMALGFRSKIRQPFNSKEQGGFFRSEYLQPRDSAILDAIAIYTTNNVDVITNREMVFNIAEEYAHAGIRLLYDDVKSGQPGSYFKKLELDIKSMQDASEIDQE
jgi:hypothetical protein